MNMYAKETHAGIGALELKQAYQGSMLSALLFAALFHMCFVGAKLIWDSASPPTVAPKALTPEGPWRPKPPPERSGEIVIRPSGSEAMLIPEIGIPKPVSDDLVRAEPAFPTRLDLEIVQGGITGNGTEVGPDDFIAGGSTLSGAADNEYIPEYNEFVAVECMPVAIVMAKPVYPEVAALTKVEGEVWVQALVGRDGRVRKARIAKASDTKVGFEGAALDAAYGSRYKPALQNNSPVAVWVTYKVVFKLSR